MDSTSWRPTGPAEEPAMETFNWRNQLQLDSRQRIVNKIMETLKRHLPVSGKDGLQALKKIAERFEEKMYAAATTQSDYLRKISLKMLTLENKSQNTVPYSLPSNKPPDGGGSVQSHSVHDEEKTSSRDVVGGDYSQNVLQGHSSSLAAWCERLSKRKCSPTKEESAPKVPRTASPLGHSSLVDKKKDKAVPQRRSSRYSDKEMGSSHFPQGKLTISCPISFSEAKELGFPPPFHFTFDPYDTGTEEDPKSLKRDLEKAMDEIASLRDKNSSLQREVEVSMDLTAACMEKLACKHKRDILSRFPDMDVSFISSNLQFITDQHKQSYQSQRPLPETSSTSLDSTVAGGDWQEEVYQKIKEMKEMHFDDLNDMYKKICSKLLQQDSLPQQPKPETVQVEKLKIFKSMLDCIISFLQISKENPLPGFKEKLGSYEKQIINFIDKAKGPGKPMPPMQHGQPADMQPMQQSQS
ncbi:hypothetical protein Tsubulata_003385 [Turnera subulata]|uniref:Mediator complex subunit 15 KIX domain-containing protein n=1 Tax=Turnera subulata TaxID=218843 RepID=A0A9Q0GEX5_9ROSI|nr:hypothetical protein Tsubulata_003385 [Turnera subulata]